MGTVGDNKGNYRCTILTENIDAFSRDLQLQYKELAQKTTAYSYVQCTKYNDVRTVVSALSLSLLSRERERALQTYQVPGTKEAYIS